MNIFVEMFNENNMKTSKILIEQSKSNPCKLIWTIANHALSENKITPNIFGLIRMNLERSKIKLS